MTYGGTARSGRSVRKPARVDGRRVVELARRLRDAGVSTPVTDWDDTTGHVCVAWCHGRRADVFLARRNAGTSVVEDLARVVSPLVALHRVTPPTDLIERYDPWRRIDPRIRLVTGHSRRRVERLRVLLAERLDPQPPGPHRVVHGDFHLGQVIVPTKGEAILLDLDDVAIGVREADYGNLAAYVATAIASAATPFDAYVHAESLAAAAVHAASTEAAGWESLRVYGAIALLRRALKLYERGAPSAYVIDWVDAVERLVAA